jgi:hypothetical protein
MRRRMRYRSSRGRPRGYRYADGGRGGLAKWAVIALLVLAALIVITSIT